MTTPQLKEKAELLRKQLIAAIERRESVENILGLIEDLQQARDKYVDAWHKDNTQIK